MPKPYLTRKESITLIAIEIIDELGFQELSIREIATRQGVSEAAIYRHFRNKQAIILSILDYYSRFDQMIELTIKERKPTPKEGITFLMNCLSESYENQPALTALAFNYEIFHYDPQATDYLKEVFLNRVRLLHDLITAGQRSNQIKTIMSATELTDLIYGFFSGQVIKWRLSGYSFPLKEQVMATLEKLLNLC